MIVRPYSSEDFEQVKALHAKQGLAYDLPDLDAPSMLVRCVIEESGKVTHAAFLRKTSEAYWLFDAEQTRRERVGNLLILSREMALPAKRAGFEDVHAFLPPEIVTKSLHRTLLYLGWEKPEWVCYSRRVA